MAALSVESVDACYGDFQALFGVSLDVEEGWTVAIIGANGAGKSTLLRAVMGQVQIGRGTIRYRGDDLGPLATHARVARGLALVPEGRRLFPSLSVSENLRIGAHVGREGQWTIERVVELFPLLARLLSRPADVLSGGEKQAVAIGRALMSNPDVLLLDEVSLGLAPIVVSDLYAAIPGIKAAGTTVVIVEQDVTLALEIADHVYCMLEGRVSLSGTPATLSHAAVTDAYFGVPA
ncbi:MAG TPA: ABC transporter ATP-binding protein [Ilumatobacter sp.]|nr:ABC transporter ATP-binding protein [Ilumatobacter sp.]